MTQETHFLQFTDKKDLFAKDIVKQARINISNYKSFNAGFFESLKMKFRNMELNEKNIKF